MVKWYRFSRIGAAGIVIGVSLPGPPRQLQHALEGISMILILSR